MRPDFGPNEVACDEGSGILHGPKGLPGFLTEKSDLRPRRRAELRIERCLSRAFRPGSSHRVQEGVYGLTQLECSEQAIHGMWSGGSLSHDDCALAELKLDGCARLQA